MIHMKTDIEARQVLIKNTYDAVEKINVMLQDYTIDYEEYFNRGMVGCNVWQAWNILRWENFIWNIKSQWYCTKPTLFGNGIPLLDGYTYVTYGGGTDKARHKLYACSSLLWSNEIRWPKSNWNTDSRLVIWYDVQPNSLGCIDTFYDSFGSAASCNINGVCTAWWNFVQPYGAYKIQFIDVKDDVDDKFGRAWDDDDTDTWKWPAAIFDNQNIKELYLISKDKKKRIILRRALIDEWDWNNTGGIWDIPSERLYSIQMLQLKWFDAWDNHDFQADVYSGVYDGVIDTWACDLEAWFICNGDRLWIHLTDPYYNYRLPRFVNSQTQDGWVNITPNDITVTDWNMIVTPTKDPEYAWAEPNQQRNPFITFYIKTAIYGENWVNKIGIANINNVVFDLQTSFNIKTNY